MYNSNNQIGYGRKRSPIKSKRRSPSKKQLAALARGRAIRMRNIKRNSKKRTKQSRTQKGGAGHTSSGSRKPMSKHVDDPVRGMTKYEIERARARLQEMSMSESTPNMSRPLRAAGLGNRGPEANSRKSPLVRKEGPSRGVSKPVRRMTVAEIAQARARARALDAENN